MCNISRVKLGNIFQYTAMPTAVAETQGQKYKGLWGQGKIHSNARTMWWLQQEWLHRLRCLNACSPADGTVWEGLVWLCWRKCVTEGGLCPVNGLLSFYMASLLSLPCGWRWEPSVVPAAIFAPPSWTLPLWNHNPIKCFRLYVAIVIVFCYNTREITKRLSKKKKHKKELTHYYFSSIFSRTVFETNDDMFLSWKNRTQFSKSVKNA